MRVAGAGVQVAVVVELKARFDEARPTWAGPKRWSACGVHVGVRAGGLKTHAKCALVVRKDDDGLRRYSHIGTGNYNSHTARLYEDVGFLHAVPKVSADVSSCSTTSPVSGRCRSGRCSRTHTISRRA